MAYTWHFKPANGSLYTGWQTAATLGVDALSFRFRHLGVDEAAWTIPGDGLANALWTYDSTIMIRYADDADVTTGTTWFVGRISTIPRQLAGAQETVHYGATGGMAWLERISYEQTWQTIRTSDNALVNVAKPRVVLGQDDAGNRITTGAQIAAALAYAITRGAPLALDASVAAGGFVVPYDERTNLKCADVVVAMMRWMPEKKLLFDYTTAGASDWIPTVKLTGPAANAKTIALSACSDVALTPRYDLVIPGVRIVYEKQHEVDGDTYSSIEIDDAGTVSNVDAAVISFDLSGSRRTYASQKVTTANYPAEEEDLDWWKLWVPWLANLDPEEVTISDVERSGSGYARYLTDGALPDWLSITRQEEVWKAKVAYTRRDANTDIVEVATDKEISVKLTSTSASTKTYRKLMAFEAAETTPTGVAAALLASWSVLHYEGAVGVVWDAFPILAASWPQPWAFGQINISGGRSEWAAMNANVQEVSVQCETGTVTYMLGPCGRLGADDRVALYQAARGVRYAWSKGARISASAAAEETQGAQGTPSNAVADGAGSTWQRLVIRGTDHLIDLDPAAVAFEDEAHIAAQEIKPREMPVLAFNETGGLVQQLAQVLASAPYGDAAVAGLPAGTTGQVLVHNGTGWAAANVATVNAVVGVAYSSSTHVLSFTYKALKVIEAGTESAAQTITTAVPES